MGRLQGKIVWVTGGGSGIGEAAAFALAGEGAAIVLTGRRPAPLDDVAGRIRELGGTAYVPARRPDRARGRARHRRLHQG
ncbi:MAG: SDR family NAD(P)-dependent oxidoreductase [Alphaproteobacteria bacterium]